jgi:shikimate kinase
MNIALIGPRCCGKTSIGRKLAEQLWWEFVDTDAMIERRAGRTIAQITGGGADWAPFRALEKQAVAEAAALDEHVIACGGGVVLDPENVAALKANSRVIWLQCESQVLWERMQADAATASQRPNLSATGGLAELTETLAARAPLYEAAADTRLDVTWMTIEQAVYHLARLCL